MGSAEVCGTSYVESQGAVKERQFMIDLHMKTFDGTTFGMSVNASTPAFKRVKRNAFTREIVRYGGLV